MKKLAMLMALVMLVSCVGLTGLAEGEDAIKESDSGFYYVEANGDQIKVSAKDRNTLIQVDGLWFRDLNKNGTLDVYEDWR